jgi:hypothetical protein
MRGDDNQQEAMFSYVSPEKRVRAVTSGTSDQCSPASTVFAIRCCNVASLVFDGQMHIL